ncbi:hypothetical protein [Pseudomonas sp. FP198]|jgi:hypothetical protein|uniref:hypothetical protein n=1 Tax=Pseudomonas sp. FP198 TaxID=2954084 RepID=UPI0027374CDA|nr:hypothetical protein [Pseudomonas sp. FP198]WLG95666.1 hypothetical protein PSH78_25590 [Pseudomonas sp. FP198]
MTDEQGLDRLQVTVSEAAIGILGRGQQRSDSVFTYAPDAYGMDLALAEMRRYMDANQTFRATGEAMGEAWKAGLARSLKPDNG